MVAKHVNHPNHRHVECYAGPDILGGHCVESSSKQQDGSLILKLTEDPETPARCGACRQSCALIHERCRRQVRECDWLDRRVWLDVPVRRMDCHRCGARVVADIAWLGAVPE